MLPWCHHPTESAVLQFGCPSCEEELPESLDRAHVEQVCKRILMLVKFCIKTLNT